MVKWEGYYREINGDQEKPTKAHEMHSRSRNNEGISIIPRPQLFEKKG